MIKPRLYADDDPDVGAFALGVLADTLAIAHPVIPFVTEEIWSHIPGTEQLLMGRRWPAADEALIDPQAEADVGGAIAAVQALRAWRDRVAAAPAAVIPARLEATGYERTADHVARLARCEWSSEDGAVVAAVTVPGGSVAVLESDAIDLEAASRRIEERRRWLDDEIARAERKLANQGFVAKAPATVVEAEREKLAGLQAERDAL
jgi:valyl-tRNA synthetase